MLTTSQKDKLYRLIAHTIGHDANLKSVKSGFNERTVAVVEEMIAANAGCNANLKELMQSLATGGQLTKGWLKKFLGSANTLLPNKPNGYACLVISKAKWKQAIYITAM